MQEKKTLTSDYLNHLPDTHTHIADNINPFAGDMINAYM